MSEIQEAKKLSEKLQGIISADDLPTKTDLACQIIQLKHEKNAVILGHNYMEPALFHSIPDFTGDSLDLCRKAAQTDKEIIVFCGVRFMAETAKILNPEKTVLLPSEKAGCSLATGITAKDVRNLKKLFPGVPVVTYVNTYADVKAESDICCTSGNAVAVMESLHSETVIFLPDEYLAKNVAIETGKHIIFPAAKTGKFDTSIDYQMIGWNARCEVHEQWTVEDINTVREDFPDVYILAHPECHPDVTQAADFSGSTNAMIKKVEDSQASRFLLLTECAMGDNIMAAHPEKEILRLCTLRCPHMSEITLEDTLKSLQLNRFVIDVPEEIRIRARKAVERMIAIG